MKKTERDNSIQKRQKEKVEDSHAVALFCNVTIKADESRNVGFFKITQDCQILHQI